MKIEKKNKDNYVDADVTQLDHSNNKYYVSTFIYIYIYMTKPLFFGLINVHDYVCICKHELTCIAITSLSTLFFWPVLFTSFQIIVKE